MIVYIGGISGVGKSTVIKGVLRRLADLEIKAELIRPLPLMAKLANLTEDECRKLPDEIKQSYRPEMRQMTYDIDSSDPNTVRIEDNRFVLLNDTDGSFLSRRIERDDDSGHIKLFVLLKADSEIILQRRVEDSAKRSDRISDPELIKRQLEDEVSAAEHFSQKQGIPLLQVENAGEIDLVVERIIEKIQEVVDSQKSTEVRPELVAEEKDN